MYSRRYCDYSYQREIQLTFTQTHVIIETNTPINLHAISDIRKTLLLDRENKESAFHIGTGTWTTFSF